MKYNTTIKGAKTATVNRAGGEAYKQTPKLELVSVLLTSFLSGDKFYESESDTTQRIVSLVKQVPLDFAAKAAVFARNEFGMRSVSHLVASEVAMRGSGDSKTSAYLKAIVRRPDDVLEILARHIAVYGKSKLTNAMRKGLGAAISGFDGYQLAKYRKDSAAISMIDAVRLLHPKATPVITQLVNGTLPAADTWETKLTQQGQTAEGKTAAWRDLVLEHKLGYMALLRNIRNILENAPEVVNELCEQLENEKAIRKSLVLPFRFTTAYKVLQDTNLNGLQKVYKSLGVALDYSVANVPDLPGETLVVMDESGSMGGKPAEIGSLFSAVLLKAVGADFMTFSNGARYKTPNLGDSVLTIAKKIKGDLAYGGTNFHAIFQEANRKYDRIVILSDMQGWMGYTNPSDAFNSYKAVHSADPFIYSFDLNGYGDMQFPENKVFCLAGWSDKIFDVMKLLESDRNALVNRIEQVEV